jgi:hypothetical protein
VLGTVGLKAGLNGWFTLQIAKVARHVLAIDIDAAFAGSSAVAGECPLSGVERTSRRYAIMSAFDPERTRKLALCFFVVA